MLNKILYTLIIIVSGFLMIGFFTVKNEAKAGIFDDIGAAITGHYEDVKDRYLKDDLFIDGNKKKFSVADWSSDSIHYVDGSVSIIEKDGDKYVQLEEDFSAGLAPDLYVYIAPGHIDSDSEFRDGEKIELGKLIKGSGASYYKIPKNLDKLIGDNFSDFSVVIHCKRFNEPMGAYHFN